MSNAELITAVKALLAEAKSYNEAKPDRVVRAKMLEMVEALHYRLESPVEVMFRQMANVSVTRRAYYRVID